MGIGVSIFLFAVGAILAFAVNLQTTGLDINTVGVVLMVVGAIGLAVSLFFLDSVGRTFGRRSVVYEERDRVVDPVPAADLRGRRRRTVTRERF
jgi:hypothetical protein